MAAYNSSMTRSSSTDSSSLSNIEVAGVGGAAGEDMSDRGVSASTPPTSLAGSMAGGSAKKAASLDVVMEEGSGRRPKRARSGVSTYNVKALSAAQLEGQESASTSRNVSGLTGRTLVNGDEAEGVTREGETPFGRKVDKAMDMEWEIPAPPTHREVQGAGKGKMQRRPSVKEKVKKVAGKVGSVLGKRGREVVEAGKRKLGGGKSRAEEQESEEEGEEEEEDEKPRWMKELDTGAKGLLDEIDLDAEPLMPPPAKKARLSNSKAALKEMAQPPAAPPPPAKASTASKKMKKWQKEGLYVGQDPDFDPTKPGGKKKLQKKRPSSAASASSSDPTAMTGDTTAPSTSKRSFMTLPMFSYLDKKRDFILPYDVFAPSYKKGDPKPKDWHQLNRNRLVGEAKDLWEKSERLPASMCVCSAPSAADVKDGELGCDDQCLNRVMQYECNDDNCNLPAHECGNRPFAELATRMKKGGAFDIGVEVLATQDRGFGVRCCRTFAPGQIIMEYTGEIISEGECQRRMREEYKDKQCYYLMELERGLIIDGTKGSMARFINHSCEPNCEVRMVKVNGTPRMGVFAGEAGIATGEELTYDYNFDNFGSTRQVCYCGAPSCRGFLSKRLNASEQKKLAKEENAKKRKAAEEAQRHAEDEEWKKKSKSDRGSSWRGWVAVDDPETKERLRREKREREEAEKTSSRAQRLAARRGSLPAGEREPEVVKKEAKRRKTTTFEPETENEASATGSAANEDSAVAGAFSASAETKPISCDSSKAKRASSSGSGSKFTEDLDRSTTVHSTSSSTITRKTEITITATETETAESVRQHSVPGLDGAADKPAAGEKKKRPIKNAIKAVGQAVKSGLTGASDSASRSGSVVSGSKGMRQSTLSFARLS